MGPEPARIQRRGLIVEAVERDVVMPLDSQKLAYPGPGHNRRFHLSCLESFCLIVVDVTTRELLTVVVVDGSQPVVMLAAPIFAKSTALLLWGHQGSRS